MNATQHGVVLGKELSNRHEQACSTGGLWSQCKNYAVHLSVAAQRLVVGSLYMHLDAPHRGLSDV